MYETTNILHTNKKTQKIERKNRIFLKKEEERKEEEGKIHSKTITVFCITGFAYPKKRMEKHLFREVIPSPIAIIIIINRHLCSHLSESRSGIGKKKKKE